MLTMTSITYVNYIDSNGLILRFDAVEMSSSINSLNNSFESGRLNYADSVNENCNENFVQNEDDSFVRDTSKTDIVYIQKEDSVCDKSVHARHIKYQLIEINTKLDSLEKNY